MLRSQIAHYTETIEGPVRLARLYLPLAVTVAYWSGERRAAAHRRVVILVRIVHGDPGVSGRNSLVALVA